MSTPKHPAWHRTAQPACSRAWRRPIATLALALAAPLAACAEHEQDGEMASTWTSSSPRSLQQSPWRAASARGSWAASMGLGGLSMRADRFGLEQQSQAFSIAVHYRLTRRWSGGLEQEWGSVRTMPAPWQREPSGGGWRLEAARSGPTAPLRGLLTWRLNPQETITLRPRARSVMIAYRLQLS